MNNIRKKFHGWILPETFIPHYNHVFNSRYSAYLGPVMGLRQPAHVVTQPTSEKENYLERIVYVGCLHGGDEEIYHRLQMLIKFSPDYLIFSGDITGSSEIERLKKHFYDDKEKNPLGEFEGYEYFGDWARTFSKQKREMLLSTLKSAAVRLLKIIQKIKEKGVNILILEGNWDNSIISGVLVIAGTDISEVFDTQKYFLKNKFQFINNLRIIQTKTTLHIFLPYFTLLHFDQITSRKLNEVAREVKKAREAKKTIIMVGHAEANWRIHHLFRGKSKAQGERARVIGNFVRAMALFQPDEVIYPHQHARIRNEEGHLVNVNAKYMLEIYRNGIRLVDKPEIETDKKEIIVTYVPLGYLAEEDFIR